MKPLFDAAKNDDLAAVERLAAAPAALHEVDEHGATALHWAGSPRVVEALLARGAAADAPDHEGKTPLYWHAAVSESVALLLARGADPIRHALKGGSTPMHRAAESNAAESLRLMLAAGAPVDVLTSTASYFPGRTPLHVAAAGNAADAARVLLAAGAAVDAADHGREGFDREGGDTPLHLAVEGEFPELVELLLAHGADPYVENKDGRVPIDLAEEIGPELHALFERR